MGSFSFCSRLISRPGSGGAGLGGGLAGRRPGSFDPRTWDSSKSPLLSFPSSVIKVIGDGSYMINENQDQTNATHGI